MAADGKVVIITELDTDGIATGTKKLKVEMESLGKEADGAGKEMDGLFGELFKADFYAEIAVGALQELGRQLVDFVADSVSAAADVKAANAQFSQTFKELEKDATKALGSIEKQTGVTATRMQGSYTKIFAFTKSVGADSAEAMDIAERAMLAAADSAAYYDKTIEEATETLQSFLKGNYENDAALGIAATETTRNAEANRLYAKSFQELSEAQKVDVLLAMVEAGNQASGALGSAAREAEEWTNVTGEAQEAMRQFQALLGAPVLEAVTPLIKNITEAIYEMIESTASMKLAAEMKNVANAIEEANVQYDKSVSQITASTNVAKKYVERLRELEKAGLTTAESQEEYAHTVGLLNALYPELNLQIDENTGRLITNIGAIESQIEAMKEQALYAAFQEQYNALMAAYADAVDAVASAEVGLKDAQNERAVIEERLKASMDLEVDELYDLAVALMDAEALYGETTASAVEAATGTDKYTNAISGLNSEEKVLLLALAKLAGEETRLNSELNKSKTKVNDLEGEIDKLGESMKTTAGNANSLGESVNETAEAYDNAAESATNSAKIQLDLFEELKTESKMSASEIVANWEKQKQAIDNYNANLQKAIEMGLAPELLKQLSDGSQESMAYLNELVNSTDVSVQEINENFGNLSESKDAVEDTMTVITSEIDDALDQAVEAAAATGPDVAEAFIDSLERNSGAILAAYKRLGINAANEFAKGVNSGSGGKVSTGKYGEVSLAAETASYSLNTASLPHLASGAVIPPRAPFMAVLGDQSSGTNIEAPLSTIEEAVHNQLGGFMAGFETLAELMTHLIQTVEGIEIGDTVIGEAVNRYQNYIQNLRGGTA